MKLVKASVGIHNGKQCYNVMSAQQPDQQNVIELLNRIPESLGGALSGNGPRVFPPLRWGICSPQLHAAILRFQRTNKGLIADGHVDPGAHTIIRLNQLAGEPDAPAVLTTTTLRVTFFWASDCQADTGSEVEYARQKLGAYGIGVDASSTRWSPSADLPYNKNLNYPDDVTLEGLLKVADQKIDHPGRLTVIVMKFMRWWAASTTIGGYAKPFVLLNANDFGNQVDDAQLLHELNNAAGGDDNEVRSDPLNIAYTPAVLPRATLTREQVDRLKRAFFAR